MKRWCGVNNGHRKVYGLEGHHTLIPASRALMCYTVAVVSTQQSKYKWSIGPTLVLQQVYSAKVVAAGEAV